jgi:hypothetical protein
MKNLFLLPTDKPSRLIKSQDNDFVYLNINAPNWFEINLKTTKQNIYITNDEEIKEGDWYVSIDENIRQSTAVWDTTIYDKCPNKKIILTTDQDLIKDGVQAIDDEFLEWFVKNQSCEEVEVRSFIDAFEWRTIYKIIIPKEEKDYTALLKPVGTKQETIEEIAERYYEDEVSINAFINGYKLAKEQFKTNKI